MGHTHGIEWNYDLAKERVSNYISVMNVEHMPSFKDLKEFYKGSCSLTSLLGRNPEWRVRIMKDLNLKEKKSNTSKGKEFENIGEKILISKGFDTERMTQGEHFDILIDDCVRVDVKCSKRWFVDKSHVNSFGINKKYATCDIYMLIALDEKENIDKVLIVPSIILRNKTTMSIGKKSKYDVWENRFDVINSYREFLSYWNENFNKEGV